MRVISALILIGVVGLLVVAALSSSQQPSGSKDQPPTTAVVDDQGSVHLPLDGDVDQDVQDQDVVEPVPADPPAASVADHAANAEEAGDTDESAIPGPLDYGTFVSHADPSHPAVQATREALETGSHPERISPFVAPPPFSQKAYDANPAAFLNQSVPARVYQVAQPSSTTPMLRAKGPRAFRADQDQPIQLSARTVPHGVVTFTTFHAGQFGNGLPSETVAADASGTATVTYLAGSGVVNDVQILAGSPQASGTIRFLVIVNHPGLVADATNAEPLTSESP